MRISEFTVRNYKSLRDAKVSFSNYTNLIGENGSGKTSFLEALYLFFEEFEIVGGNSSPTLHEITSFHRRNLPLEFAAKITFEKEECADIFPDYVLKKLIKLNSGKGYELTINRRIPAPQAPWETVSMKIGAVPLVKDNSVSSTEDIVKSLSLGGELAKQRPIDLRALLFHPEASQSNLVGNRLVILNDAAYPMDAYTDSLVKEGKIPFQHLPGQDHIAWANSQGKTLVENPLTKEKADALVHQKEKQLNDKMVQSIVGKIAKKIKGQLKLIPAARDERVEPGRRASFVSTSTIVNPLSRLHASDDQAWYLTSEAIEDLIGQRLDSVPVLSTWEKNLRLPTNLIGGGQQGIIGLVYQVYVSSEPIIAIEEPETHLHHNLCKRMFKLLRDMASTKQLIVSTHSECFAEISGTSKNWFLQRKAKEVKPVDIKTKDGLLKAFGVMGAEPSDRGYPNKIVFVSGETEEGVLPIWAQTLQVNINQTRIEPLRGEYDSRMIGIITRYIEEAQTKVFLMVDGHAADKVKEAVDKEHRLILGGTIEDCYPIPILIEALDEYIGLKVQETDIDAKQPRVDEIKRLLKEKKDIPRTKTFWKCQLGVIVAKHMSETDISKEIVGFVKKLAS